jgi:hypothetical protein
MLVTVCAGVLETVPAKASFGVVVDVGVDEAYSPFDGPATVTFTFGPSDDAAVFTVRLRRPGHRAIKEKDYLVDPAAETSPYAVTFPWKPLAVSEPTDYVVDVRRQGDSPITDDTFTVLPPLVSELSATPSPFYPLIEDGYKDDTHVRFTLAADVSDAVLHLYADDAYGRCCGAEVRTVDLGPLAWGTRGWTWDGTRDDASPAPKGTYFARVSATDLADISSVSRALKISLTTGTIRLTATREKSGSAYARTADERETARGGECFATRDPSDHTAHITCVNAVISVYWRWVLNPGERIESAKFVIDGGSFGCHHTVDHTKTETLLRVHAPPTSTCYVSTARIVYSYPVHV